jgi:phosphatidylethanolamine-binding protein (PEBP) family uncharacterized protein
VTGGHERAVRRQKDQAGHGTHTYYFHLYALDREPDLPVGLSRSLLLDAIDKHILEQACIWGTFGR